MQVMTVWAAALLLKISCPCPAGPIGMAARLQDEERRRWLKAGADAGDVDAPAAPGGAMDAALRKAGGLNEDDAELEAHEAEVARRGASTRAVAGAVLPEAAPRRRPTTYQDVYATVATRADELEIGEGEWEPRRRLKEACDHAKAEAAQAERQVEARRAALQAWEGSRGGGRQRGSGTGTC